MQQTIENKLLSGTPHDLSSPRQRWRNKFGKDEYLGILTTSIDPALLVIVEELTRHIRVLWGIEKLTFSYANRTALDGHIIAFSRDIVAGNTPPTIAIDDEWWNLEDHP